MTIGELAAHAAPDGNAENPLVALVSQAARFNPYPVFDALREAGPLFTENGRVLLVGDYANCSRILRDRTTSNNTAHSPTFENLQLGVDLPPLSTIFTPSIFFMDAPDHTRQRKLVVNAFSPRIMAQFEPWIRAIVDELFAAFVDRGHVDVVEDLAYPLPMRIICELFAIPAEEYDLLKKWSDELGLFSEVPIVGASVDITKIFSRDEVRQFFSNSLAIHAYFAELIHKRRKNPGDDLVSSLLMSENQGQRLTRFEVTNVVMTLFAAAHESTTNLLSNGILALLRHPDQLDLLRRDPGVIGTLVEEVLRFDPPVHMAARSATVPMRIGELDVEPGTIISVLIAAANRDPAEFPDPGRFDVTRKPQRGALSFGAGTHFCIGSALAKLEAEIALTAFAQRLRDPVLDEDSLGYRRHVLVRGLDRMIVHFTP